MTSKNSLINIVNLTQILRCKIAWPLRCVICILISFIVILLSVNNCFAQAFNVEQIDGIYNSLDYIENIKPNQAVLSFSVKPNDSLTSASIITYEDIKKGVINPTQYNRVSGYGRYYVQDDTRYVVSLIDASTFYVQSTSDTIRARIIPRLQEQLANKGLGSVSLRSAYISLITTNIAVSPLDFRGYIQPWVVAGLVIAILIPAWCLCRRFLRG